MFLFLLTPMIPQRSFVYFWGIFCVDTASAGMHWSQRYSHCSQTASVDETETMELFIRKSGFVLWKCKNWATFVGFFHKCCTFFIFLAATKQLYKWYFPSVCLSVRLSVCHTFFTMFPSSYHHEIFRSYYHGQKWCPCKRSKSEVKGQGHRGQHPT